MTARLCGFTLILSAAGYAASFPPFGYWWLMPLAMALFFLSLKGLQPRPAFVAGFAHGLVTYALALPWMWLVFGPIAAMLWGILATFHALFALASSVCAPRLHSDLHRALWLALAWTAFEYIRAEVFWLKFPWATVSLARGPNLLLPWLGVYSAGLLLVIGVTLVLEVRRRWIGGIVVAIWYLLPMPSSQPESGEPINVTAVQAEGATPEQLLRLSEAAPLGTDFILWPEYAYPGNLLAAKQDLRAIQTFLGKRQCLLVIGAQTYAPRGSEWFNTALTLSSDKVVGQHIKNHTVHLFDDGTPGGTAEAITTPKAKIGTPICFDCDFQDVVRAMAADGAECFLVPSMDVANWGKSQHLQHAALARIRAAENARWILVASSSGQTQLIAPSGKLIAGLPLFDAGHLSGQLHPSRSQTLFTRIGWMFGPACIVLALLTGIPWGRRH